MARVSGLVSGLDTDALIQELVSAYQTKQDTYVKKQTKLEWTQEIWKELNTKVYSFYSGVLSNARFSNAYNLKKATVSDSSKATVTADSSAVVGTQTLSVKQLAKTAYLTGGKLKRTQNTAGQADTTTKLTGNSKLKELGFVNEADGNTVKVNINGKETAISVNEDTTINQFVVKLKEAGLTASFDATNQRIFVSSSKSGKDNEFSITAANAGGQKALEALGLNAVSTSDVKTYQEKASINVQEATDTAYVKYVLTQANADLNAQLSGLKDQYKYATEDEYRDQKEEQWQKAIDGYDESNTKIQDTIADILAWNGVDAAEDDDENNTAAVSAPTVNDFVTQNADGTYSFLSKYMKDSVDEDGSYVLDEDGNRVQELDEDALQADLGANMTVDQLKAQLGELNANVAQMKSNDAMKQSIEDTRTLYQDAYASVQADDTIKNKIEALEAEIDTNTKLLSQTYDFTNPQAITYTDLEGNSVSMSYADLTAKLNNYAVADGETAEAIENGLTGSAAYKAIYDSYKTAYTNEQQSAQEQLDKLNLTANSTDDEIKAAVAKEAADNASGDGPVRVEGQDAEIVLNGATFTSTTNNFAINGLTITATGEMKEGEEITVSVATDIDGMYNSIKSLLTGYNDILKQMNTLYYADSAKGYEPLTDAEKDAMTDTEIEKWEEKIKSSLLRRDDTLSSIMGVIQTSMMKSYTINGKSYSLSSFGINTAGYFSVDNENRGLYHIDGDPDDTSTSGNSDKLRAALASDPESVTLFFQKLADEMYTQLSKKMRSTTLRSAYTIYNDKQMTQQYKEYDDIIEKWDEKIETYTQKYVKQFTAMETALAKLQSSTSALAGLIG